MAGERTRNVERVALWLGSKFQIPRSVRSKRVLWYCFDSFRLCPSERILLREGNTLDVTPRTFDVLAFLVEKAPGLVTNEALVARVWKVPEVEHSNVTQQVYYARRLLNDVSIGGKYRYIERVAGSGYRFVTPVESREHLWSFPAGNVPAPDSGNGMPKYRVWLAVLAVLLIPLLAMLAPRLVPARAKAINPVQLTHDGIQKAGPLVSDGKVIVFSEPQSLWSLVSVPVSGGSPAPIKGVPVDSAGVPLDCRPSDLSRDGKRLLAYHSGAHGSELWSVAVAGGPPQYIGEKGAGAWAPDGKGLALSDDSNLTISRPNQPTVSVEIGRPTTNIRWSPDGRTIRFDVRSADSASIWEVRADGSSLHAQRNPAAMLKFSCCGVWGWDENHFFFQNFSAYESNIWVTKGSGFLSGLSSRPVTQGPANWRYPFVSNDLKKLFVIRDMPRAELVYFDNLSSRWQPYWGGAAAYELNFTRDDKNVAYIHYPDHTLWIRESNSGRNIQLTAPGLQVHQPHWSPDGAKIAFRARKNGGPFQVYLISATGGIPAAVAASGFDQGVPTWSGDGKIITFGDRPGAKLVGYMTIHNLDVSTGHISDMPHSNGLWNSRWSPDGKHVLALSVDRQSLYILDYPGTEWRQVARMFFIDHPCWSADSRSIYFNGRPDNRRMKLFKLAALPDATIETITDLRDFAWMPDNWFGVTPDGKPLALRDGGTQDIFAFDLDVW